MKVDVNVTIKRYYEVEIDKTKEEIEEMTGDELFAYCDKNNLIEEEIDDIEIGYILP